MIDYTVFKDSLGYGRRGEEEKEERGGEGDPGRKREGGREGGIHYSSHDVFYMNNYSALSFT